jgi:hypothetical protein
MFGSAQDLLHRRFVRKMYNSFYGWHEIRGKRVVFGETLLLLSPPSVYFYKAKKNKRFENNFA